MLFYSSTLFDLADASAGVIVDAIIRADVADAITLLVVHSAVLDVALRSAVLVGDLAAGGVRAGALGGSGAFGRS